MEVIIKRSDKRKKTIQARMVGGRMEVLAPSYISDAALQGHIARLQARLMKRDAPRNDDHLQARASHLNKKVFSWGSDLELHQILYTPGAQARILQLYHQDHSHQH